MHAYAAHHQAGLWIKPERGVAEVRRREARKVESASQAAARRLEAHAERLLEVATDGVWSEIAGPITECWCAEMALWRELWKLGPKGRPRTPAGVLRDAVDLALSRPSTPARRAGARPGL